MFFWLLVIFILGSAIGSFLNVVIDRSVRRESISGRSYCDHCKATLQSIDLIPIVSFVGLGAKCRFCKKPISWQYPLVEATAGLLFCLSFLVLVQRGELNLLMLAFSFFLISILIVVAVIDLKYFLIPTGLVYLASLVVLFYNFFSFEPDQFVLHVISGLLLAGLFVTIVLVTRGRGMGIGDIPLSFLLGLILGWPQTFVAVFLAFASGALVSVWLLLTGKRNFGQAVPFGPFLVLGIFLSMFAGEKIINWYLTLL